MVITVKRFLNENLAEICFSIKIMMFVDRKRALQITLSVLRYFPYLCQNFQCKNDAININSMKMVKYCDTIRG